SCGGRGRRRRKNSRHGYPNMPSPPSPTHETCSPMCRRKRKQARFAPICCWIAFSVAMLAAPCAMAGAGVLGLGTPSYGNGGEVSMSGVVLAPRGDSITHPPLWDWGDGTIIASWFAARHEYRKGGTYAVRVTATSVGGHLLSAGTAVTIPPVDPVCSYDLQIKP